MLYSIIPPILVVLSLVGIIVFLVKKAPDVSRLGVESRPANAGEIDLREPGFLGRSVQKLKQTNLGAGKNAVLSVLEKIMKALRFIFLRLGVLFSRGWLSLKNRQKKEPPKEAAVQNDKVMTEDDRIIEKIKSYVPEKKIVIKKAGENPKTADFVVEPMISKTAVKPRAEMKDRLEELLVERIAANPKDIEAYQRLGQYYMEIENYEYAKECFKQIVKLNPLERNAKYTLKKLERLI
jgi:tetratricopeptide (TPR) repeat protein